MYCYQSRDEDASIVAAAQKSANAKLMATKQKAIMSRYHTLLPSVASRALYYQLTRLRAVLTSASNLSGTTNHSYNGKKELQVKRVLATAPDVSLCST